MSLWFFVAVLQAAGAAGNAAMYVDKGESFSLFVACFVGLWSLGSFMQAARHGA